MSGRRDELATLRECVLGHQRLTTLTGPGGIGKSWLARLAADDLGRSFTDGTHVVELGDLPEVGLLAQAVARSMGLQLDGLHDDLSELVPLVDGRHVLLVLDRCEHLLPRCAGVVAGLLRGCPRVHVLATSRQPLGITGERVLTVPPLSVPADPSTVDPLTAMAHDAVALYVERATAVLPGFRLTADNVAAVSAVCARLDGNPLAIELAAARAGLLAPQAILDRLDDRYRLLTKGAADAPPQLRSLRASVEASWDLCTEQERRLWARISVFPADFELDAVEEVCSGEGIDEVDVLDLVDSLLEKSVLVREAEPVAVRYRMLETLRTYGAGQLGPGGSSRWSVEHLRWVERLALRAGAEWFGPRQTTHLHRLRREQLNLVVALDKATVDPAAAAPALRTVCALEPFWVVGGGVTQARRWLVAALDHDSGTPEERTRALALAAWFAAVQEDVDEAGVLLGQAARVQEVTSPTTLSAVARARGGVALARADLETADASFEDSVALATRGSSAAAVAEGWLMLGLTRVLAGRGDEADRALRRCIAFCDHAGESQVRASALALRALDALGRGAVSDASALAHEALRSKVEAGDRFAVALLLEVIGWVALTDDDPVRTAILVGAAERMWRTVGLRPAWTDRLTVGRDERLTAARAALGRREFDRHAARGAAMTWEVVVRYAQEDQLPRQRRPTTSAPLTSRELAVAELVARGMSNREIAAALVISVRTVQGHVENILRKLGFGSRAQVAAWVAQRGVERRP